MPPRLDYQHCRLHGGLWYYWPRDQHAPSHDGYATLEQLCASGHVPTFSRHCDLSPPRIPLPTPLHPPVRGALYLPWVRTKIITTSAAKRRQIAIAEQLDELGFLDRSWHVAETRRPYWQPLKAAHEHLLATEQPPLLILEDDAAIANWEPNLWPPSEATVAYLGGSIQGQRRGRAAAEKSGEGWTRIGNYARKTIDAQWSFVAGMWTSHAILWLREDTMRTAATTLRNAKLACDRVFAANQYAWRAILIRHPIFFQRDGHNDARTLNYG